MVQQLAEIQRAIPLVFGVRLEDHPLDLAHQTIRHTPRRAELLDECWEDSGRGESRQVRWRPSRRVGDVWALPPPSSPSTFAWPTNLRARTRKDGWPTRPRPSLPRWHRILPQSVDQRGLARSARANDRDKASINRNVRRLAQGASMT